MTLGRARGQLGCVCACKEGTHSGKGVRAVAVMTF
jgi:hypothetical protein